MSKLTQFRVGAQSYSFREFDFEGSIKSLEKLGVVYIEYCAVHFPPDPGHKGFARIKERLAEEGIKTLAFGVEGFGGDEAANRRKFEFGQALGIEVFTADPTPDSFGNLDKLTEEFGIKIAIHNHGPKARYDKVKDTLDAVKGHSPLIGACIDTGHVIRSGENPVEAAEQLGDRVLSLHLKDWAPGGDEQILGNGALDMAALVRTLDAIRFTGPIMMEYENSPENPVPEMRIGLENWLNACESA